MELRLHLRQQRLDLAPREDNRQVRRAPCAHDVLDPWQILLQDLAVEEQNGAQRLVLGRSRYLPLNGEVGQKPLYLDGAHVTRMALAVEQNESTYPADISVLCAIAVMLCANPVANELK